MAEKMFVKPAPGLTVRDPETREPLPPEGAEVPRSPYWLRRVNGGDVTVDTASTQKTKTK